MSQGLQTALVPDVKWIDYASSVCWSCNGMVTAEELRGSHLQYTQVLWIGKPTKLGKSKSRLADKLENKQKAKLKPAEVSVLQQGEEQSTNRNRWGSRQWHKKSSYVSVPAYYLCGVVELLQGVARPLPTATVHHKGVPPHDCKTDETPISKENLTI